MYRRILQQRDSPWLLHKLQATSKTERGYAYAMDGDLLSLDLLLSIDDFYNLYELHPGVATEPLVVAELGAGWGRLGHVPLAVNPKLTYVVMDLPEILLVCQTYLPKTLPHATVADYRFTRTVERFTRGQLLTKNLWFAGAQAAARFEPGAVDIAVNIASFQEMPLAYVEQYMTCFSGMARGGHVYLRQLRDGSAHGHHFDEIAGIDAYPFPPEWQRQYLRASVLSDEFFEAGYAVPSA